MSTLIGANYFQPDKQKHKTNNCLPSTRTKHNHNPTSCKRGRWSVPPTEQTGLCRVPEAPKLPQEHVLYRPRSQCRGRSNLKKSLRYYQLGKQICVSHKAPRDSRSADTVFINQEPWQQIAFLKCLKGDLLAEGDKCNPNIGMVWWVES
jgi:hypothetical protein